MGLFSCLALILHICNENVKRMKGKIYRLSNICNDFAVESNYAVYYYNYMLKPVAQIGVLSRISMREINI